MTAPTVPTLPAGVNWDERGLVVAVAQDRLSGRVQMVAWMNAEALAVTLATKKATFFSRSRGRLWTKGETSGHTLDVHAVHLDCDGDALLVLVEPNGPSCHTGEDTCFFARVEGDQGLAYADVATPVFDELTREIESRKASDGEKSYTKSLLDKGPTRIGEKLREEADELARAIAGESDERVAAEAADLLYHLMVGLAARGLDLEDVARTLAKRRGTSGHAEKAARPKP